MLAFGTFGNVVTHKAFHQSGRERLRRKLSGTIRSFFIWRLQSGEKSIATASLLDTTDCEIASCLAVFTMLPVRTTASRTFNCSLCQVLMVSLVSYECIFRFSLLRWICHAILCIQYLYLVELGEIKSASEKPSGRLSVSAPPLNSGSAAGCAALSWLIGAAALA
jgi:hypothetical protein